MDEDVNVDVVSDESGHESSNAYASGSVGEQITTHVGRSIDDSDRQNHEPEETDTQFNLDSAIQSINDMVELGAVEHDDNTDVDVDVEDDAESAPADEPDIESDGDDKHSHSSEAGADIDTDVDIEDADLAETIGQQLGDAIWADISQSYNSNPGAGIPPTTSSTLNRTVSCIAQILAYLPQDTQAERVLSSYPLTVSSDGSESYTGTFGNGKGKERQSRDVLTVLKSIHNTGVVGTEDAEALAEILEKIADGDLFVDCESEEDDEGYTPKKETEEGDGNNEGEEPMGHKRKRSVLDDGIKVESED